jgi:hypothetical protein
MFNRRPPARLSICVTASAPLHALSAGELFRHALVQCTRCGAIKQRRGALVPDSAVRTQRSASVEYLSVGRTRAVAAGWPRGTSVACKPK